MGFGSFIVIQMIVGVVCLLWLCNFCRKLETEVINKDPVSFSDISLCVRKESDSIGWMNVSAESGFA
jgi:hypothetical protein